MVNCNELLNHCNKDCQKLDLGAVVGADFGIQLLAQLSLVGVFCRCNRLVAAAGGGVRCSVAVVLLGCCGAWLGCRGVWWELPVRRPAVVGRFCSDRVLFKRIWPCIRLLAIPTPFPC